jgi:hypothetical protein
MVVAKATDVSHCHTGVTSAVIFNLSTIVLRSPQNVASRNKPLILYRWYCEVIWVDILRA